MAASKASPSTTTTVSVSSSTSSSSSSSSTTNNTSLTTTTTSLTATPDICHNFHELCRSCGKTNDQLYDLFQSPQSSSSPFNTSSTTCYTHLNNSCTSSTSLATATNKTSTTAVGNNCAKTATTTLDTVAATAKASAKGQSNMDNILQEMQIWQLMIKCNDGLPQRICAKCTAQFYMIHKFRRKCLKVQTQLRALNEEQKIYERQQESNEKNETKTETTETEAIGIAIEQSEPTLQLAEAEAVKPCELLKNQDLVNDKPSEQEQQQQQEQEAALIQTKSSSSSSTSVSFETIAGNTNKDCKVATLLDNNAVETMPKQTTPTSSALAVNDKTFETHDQGTLTRLKHKDEKKPLLKAAVLNSIRPSSALTLQQPLEQICDNEALEGDALANANKKLCLDQEDLLAAHVIFKTTSSTTTTTNNSKQSTDSNEENPNTRSDELKRKTPELKLTQDSAFSKTQTESLFLTKAALKAYTIPHTSTTGRIIENVTNSEAKSNNDNNNNAHLCDNNSELNDNTCSSTSSSLTPSSSSSTSSKSSSSLTKLYRTKVLRHKIVKYVAYSSGSSSRSSGRRSGYCSKSKKTLVNQSGILVGKRKQRSWKNKHKLKRLNAMRTCASPASQVELKQQIKNLQIEDETSSTVSTISSTTSSSSSLTTTTAIITTTTTPAVSNLVGGNLENIKSSSYCKNAIETGCPSIEGISSNKSCLMWKTKAAMKANANDMPEDIVHVKNNVKALSNITAISLPHTATETPLTGSACLATETDTSSKTLNENQSSVSSSHNNNNNILMEEYCLTNKALTSTDNQVKDTEDESTPNLNNNLWPEEADQKQIKANKPNENAINENSPKEFIKCNKNEEEEDEEEPKELREKHEEPEKGAVVLTPPAKVGCMKLIIQRKRGARFKCRRKEEDDDETTSTHNNLEPTTPKRRRKTSTNTNLKTKLEMESLFSLQHKENDELKHSNEEEDEGNCGIIKNVSRKVPEFNSEEDENKENPIDIENHHDFDSDSNVSVYRDPLLTRNEMLEEDTHLTDFPKPQLSLQTECSKEMYKLYKEKANLESPKKLIVRVPLTSLTQDFKRMHLTMDQENQDNDMENDSSQHKDQHNQTQNELNEQENKEQPFSLQNLTEQEEKLSSNQLNSSQSNISSGQSDLLGFSQNTEASSSTEESSQKEVEMVRYVEPPLCSASSKINDFINDFQNNCIDSSEIDESCDMVPHLGPQINQELSDEIRDVEDTLNGILSEMHDKDMYTPRSGETDEFFAHSVYSPLTDSPTTPAHSFYAESPCTINSNPMSVSPFIHQNMDYNAMTPQSNHSSMGHSSSHMGSGSGGSSSSHAGVFSEHFPTYNECFEETTQSELIGFQNDIPCFENIEINNNPGNNNDFAGNQGEYNEEEEVNQMPSATNANICSNNVQSNDKVKAGGEIVDYIDLSDYKENSEDYVATQATQVSAEMDQQQQTTNTELLPNQVTYQAATYQPSIQMQNTPNNMPTQPHYIVTNTNQGPILIANPHINQTAETIEPSFKPHSNNLQFVTLGQAMEAPNQTPSNHLTEINWSPSVNPSNNFNQQPVISTSNNGTTTYFINANGELYQANIPATTLQNPTIIVPTANTNQTFNKANIDNNENYMQQQQQPTQPQTHNNGQYIMLVNNLGGTPQYYATTHANLNQSVQTPATSTVLFHPNQARQVPNRPNYVTNATKQVHNTTTTTNTTATETNSPKTTLVPITPNLEPSTQTIHQRINQQLQRQIKQRQLQLLQPRSPNVTQKITLICRFCHKRPKFTNNVDYSNHIINTHPAEKPYNCPHCPMHFTRRFERQQHVAQVHGSRYQCAQCGLSFCAQRTLDFHLQKYHANLGRSHHQQQQQQQHLQQQNSTSTTTTTTPAAAATYQLLQHNQQQRLVRVEDVHVQVTGENKNKRSIDLTLDGDADIQTSQSMPEVDLLSSSPGIQQHQQQQARKLGCPDCNGDNDDCCGSNKNHDQQQQHNNSNNIQQEVNLQQQQQQQYAGNESVNNHQQHPQHITIPSPEQTEPDSTTTLRHFRKRQLSELTPHFATSPSSSSSSSSTSSSSSFNNNIISKNRAATNNNNNDNLNHNSPDNVLAGDVGSVVRGDNGGEQIMVERSLRGTHNCLLCEESFTNEIALRKHHHLAHGAAQSTINTAATSSALVCAICKRSFRMRNALQRHMETHDAEGRPYECNICQVRFPRPSQLTLHKLTVHKFEKPNTCEECGKQFGTESAMKAHAKEHEEAGSLTASSASDTSTLSSSSSSPPSEISSRIYLETMTTKTTSISTSTSSITTITKNEQNINLQSTTSGEVCSSASNAITTNNDNNTVAVYNIATQNTIVSGLST